MAWMNDSHFDFLTYVFCWAQQMDRHRCPFRGIVREHGQEAEEGNFFEFFGLQKVVIGQTLITPTCGSCVFFFGGVVPVYH